jgi:hypothetical protein
LLDTSQKRLKLDRVEDMSAKKSKANSREREYLQGRMEECSQREVLDGGDGHVMFSLTAEGAVQRGGWDLLADKAGQCFRTKLDFKKLISEKC